MSDLITMMSAAAGQVGGDYQISRSLRFNSADSAYLSRTPASAGNRKTWTWSGWVKRSKFSGSFYFFCGNSALSNAGFLGFSFEGNDRIEVTGWTTVWRSTSAQYRDPSAWYHVVVVLDTTQATADNRVRVYVNGEEVTAFATKNNPTQNDDLGVNTAASHYISSYDGTNSDFDGYLADINFIDGQALTPSSFGEVDATTGVWKPIAYAGTYGTNGFHLDFSDNSSTTALGYDAAGSNDWTPNNFSVTAGAGNDSLVDTPTQYGTDTGAGGEVRGNYSTLNVLSSPQLAGQYVISNGNLDITGASSTYNSYAPSTIALPSSGKYYFEYTCTNPDAGQRRDTIGLAQTTASGIWLGNTGSIGYDAYEGKVNNNSSNIATYASWDNGDVVSVAVDCDTGYVWFGKNGTWQAGNPSAGTGATATLSNISTYAFAVGTRAAASAGYTVKGSINFGQRPFAYTAPSGFKALVTTNLPEPTVVQGDDYFNTLIWTGDEASTRSFTGVGFQPDILWSKSRSFSQDHLIFNAIVGAGAGKALVPNKTLDEASVNDNATYGYVSSFDSDGFSVVKGTSGSETYYNSNAQNYVAWLWKANGAGVSNTDGTITSTVSANTTAGISIVTWTNTNTASATIGHGLGAVPSMIILKFRSSTSNWSVYHKALGPTKRLTLNTTSAENTGSDFWNDTAPTSSVFTIGSGLNQFTYTNSAIVFAEVEGFSKFGSFVGAGGTDNTFIYCGFRPAWVVIKRTDSTSNWFMHDDKRSPYNVAGNLLRANLSDAELSPSTLIDILSNGFKLRDAGFGSGESYIFMAFSSNPFKTSLAR